MQFRPFSACQTNKPTVSFTDTTQQKPQERQPTPLARGKENAAKRGKKTAKQREEDVVDDDDDEDDEHEGKD